MEMSDLDPTHEIGPGSATLMPPTLVLSVLMI